jgi:hypothetical protein
MIYERTTKEYMHPGSRYMCPMEWIPKFHADHSRHIFDFGYPFWHQQVVILDTYIHRLLFEEVER